MADFHLADSVSESWYCLCLLGHFNETEPTLVLLVTCTLPGTTCQNVCGEERIRTVSQSLKVQYVGILVEKVSKMTLIYQQTLIE